MNRMERALTGLLVCLTLLVCTGCSGQSMSIQSELPSYGNTSAATEIESLQPGKSGDLPDSENGYLVQESMGEAVQVDLDGDGTLETLTITTRQVEQKMGQSHWKKTTLSSLTIDGKEFIKENDGEGRLNVPNVVLDTPESKRYFLADLNAGDHKLEIALLDYGASNDLTTTYLRYEDGQLTSLGTVSGFPDQDSSSLDGKGNVTAPGRLSLLQNWQAPFVYQLKGDVLEKAPQSWYTPIVQSKQRVVLKKAIKIYSEPDQNAAATVAQPNQVVTAFPATDNKHWVQVRLADGTEGWFYMEDGATILSGEQKYTAMEVFDNLNMSD